MQSEFNSSNTADADKIMNDAVADFERRIVAISEAKKAQGNAAAVSKYVPSCADHSNLYCLGAYTYSLGAAMNKNGVSPKENGLLQFTAAERETYASKAWGSPQISCPAAANYFESNKNDALKACGQSLKDAPEGTTLGDMLVRGYQDGSIPKGSLVLLKRSGNTSTGMHAAMFVGVNENGEPLFSCANPEIVRKPIKEWANQQADPKRSKDTDCYVVNMHSALSAKLSPADRETVRAPDNPEKGGLESVSSANGRFFPAGREDGGDGKTSSRLDGADNQAQPYGRFFKVGSRDGEKASGRLDGADNQAQPHGRFFKLGSRDGEKASGRLDGADNQAQPHGRFFKVGNRDGERKGGFQGKDITGDLLKSAAKFFDSEEFKKAAQKVSDYLGQAVHSAKEMLSKTAGDLKRRLVRNEIRSRAKMRVDRKTAKLAKQKHTLGKTRDAENGKVTGLKREAPAKKAVLRGSGLMKMLMSNSAEASSKQQSSRSGFNEKMQKVSVTKRAIIAKSDRSW